MKRILILVIISLLYVGGFAQKAYYSLQNVDEANSTALIVKIDNITAPDAMHQARMNLMNASPQAQLIGLVEGPSRSFILVVKSKNQPDVDQIKDKIKALYPRPEDGLQMNQLTIPDFKAQYPL